MRKVFDREEFGSRIRAIRERAGLSQQKFAQMCGLNQGNIANVELGKNAPGVDFLHQIHIANSNIDLHWLLTGEGEMTSSADPAVPSKSSPPAVEDELVRELGEVRVLASRSSQGTSWAIIHALLTANGALSRGEVARTTQLEESEILADIALLKRVGLVVESAAGLIAAGDLLQTKTPADGAELALEIMDIVLRRVLPAADKADGSGRLLRVEAAVGDASRMIDELRELIRAKLEGDTGDQRVTLILGMTRSTP